MNKSHLYFILFIEDFTIVKVAERQEWFLTAFL